MTTDSGMDVSPSWQELKEERDDLEERYHLLASEMVYEGNSVQHWQQKAMAYKECAGAVYDLKQLVGAGTPAEVVKAVQALAAHVEAARRILYLRHTERALSHWSDTSPATSLARLKSQWQAEALNEVVMVFADPDSESALDVVEYAAELAAMKLRQVEGGE